MINQDQIDYLNNLIKFIIKQNEKHSFEIYNKKHYFHIYVWIVTNTLNDFYNEMLKIFDLSKDINFNYSYKDCNFIIQISHYIEDKDVNSPYYTGDYISFKCLVDNFRQFMNEFDLKYSQVEESINLIIKNETDKINKANENINKFKDFLGIPLEFA